MKRAQHGKPESSATKKVQRPGEVITPEEFEAVTDALRDRVVERFSEK